jgi:hypothetical protein
MCAGRPEGHESIGRAGVRTRLRLPAAQLPGAARRAFPSRMVSPAGRAGARLSGARSAAREGFARVVRFDGSVRRGRTAFDTATGKPSSLPSNGGAPAIQAPAHPAGRRIRFWKSRVPRPIEGLGSFGAPRTLRTRCWRADGARATSQGGSLTRQRLPGERSRARATDGRSTTRSMIATRRRAPPMCTERPIRSVRPARTLSRPLMG